MTDIATEEKSEALRTEPEDAALLIARSAVALTFEDLPLNVVDITKKAILDTIGVCIPASTTSPEAQALFELMIDAGGKEEATVLGFGKKLPAWQAGYMNGALVNCEDFSDLHPDAAHISSAVVPAAVAMAERLGLVDGRRFITAVALGVDLQCRLTLAAGKPGGKLAPWHTSPLFGVFGAALACSKLLRLDEDRTLNALGLAFVQAAGTQEIVFGKDSTVRGFGHAVPGEVGVRAALMAERGITGVRNCFEGEHGLWNAYYGGNYDRDMLVGNLGQRWDVLEDGFKPWPSCGFTHVFIDMVREVIREHSLRPDEVERITLTVGNFAGCQTEPLEEWRCPKNAMLAKLSIPFTVAVAVQNGNVCIRDYFDENLTNPAVLQMADRVFSRIDSRYDFVAGAGFPGGELEVLTRDGRHLTRAQPHAYGHPEKPMSWDDLVAKFKECAGYAARPVPPRELDRAIAMFANLENVDDVGDVITLITQS